MKRADTRPLLHHPPNAPSREINYDHQEPPSGQGSYHREGPEKGIGTGLLHQHPFHLPHYPLLYRESRIAGSRTFVRLIPGTRDRGRNIIPPSPLVREREGKDRGQYQWDLRGQDWDSESDAIFKLELSFSRCCGASSEALLETREEMEHMGTGKETETANEKEKGSRSMS